MPYSKQKAKKKLAKLERKYYHQYVLKFNIHTSFYLLEFDIRTSLNVLEVCVSNLSTEIKVRI